MTTAMSGREGTIPHGRIWAFIAAALLVGCTATGSPPATAPDRLAEFQATCRAIWVEELGRPIDSDGPDALSECLRRAQAGETGDQIRASVQTSGEYRERQARLRREADEATRRTAGRRGVVRFDRHVAVDDGGPFNALGASLFWAAWGYQHDRTRLESNLLALSGTFDYIRVLGVVGPSSGWEDRTVDARDPTYATTIAGLTDLAYDAFGLRVQWTIFGGTDSTPSSSERERLIDRFAAMAIGREHKIFAFEIVNEGFANFGTAGDLRDASPVAAVSNPDNGWKTDAKTSPDRSETHRSEESSNLAHILRSQFSRTADRSVVAGDVNRLRLEHFKVLRSIVVPPRIQVMHHLAGIQWSTKLLFGDQNTSPNVSVLMGARMGRPKDQDVALMPRGPALPSVGARAAPLKSHSVTEDIAAPAARAFRGLSRNELSATAGTEERWQDWSPRHRSNLEYASLAQQANWVTEVRSLGRRLNDQTIVPVGLSAPDPNVASAVCDTYAGSAADFATMHYERARPGSLWNATRQPWGYPGEYDARCRGQLPAAVSNNEPIGPQSSVQADEDPVRVGAMAFAATLVSQNCCYVLHTGAGIRGGGVADRARGRAANVWEIPRWHELVISLQAARRSLPDGLANWSRHNAQWTSAPFADFDRAVDDGRIVRAYAATHGADFIVVVLGARAPVTARPRARVALDVLHPATGDVLRHLELDAGEVFRLDGLEAFILRGSQQ